MIWASAGNYGLWDYSHITEAKKCYFTVSNAENGLRRVGMGSRMAKNWLT